MSARPEMLAASGQGRLPRWPFSDTAADRLSGGFAQAGFSAVPSVGRDRTAFYPVNIGNSK